MNPISFNVNTPLNAALISKPHSNANCPTCEKKGNGLLIGAGVLAAGVGAGVAVKKGYIKVPQALINQLEPLKAKLEPLKAKLEPLKAQLEPLKTKLNGYLEVAQEKAIQPAKAKLASAVEVCKAKYASVISK